jgi:hypothetical protein
MYQDYLLTIVRNHCPSGFRGSFILPLIKQMDDGMDEMSVRLDGWTASGEASLHGFRGSRPNGRI